MRMIKGRLKNNDLTSTQLGFRSKCMSRKGAIKIVTEDMEIK